MPAIYQVLPGFNTKDAICNEVLLIREYFRNLGYKSEIYVDVLLPNHEGKYDLYKFKSFRPREEDIILYHFSVYDRITHSIHRLKGRWILRYHNITPAEFFLRWDYIYAGMLENGRALLPVLKNLCDHYIADSEYNKSELIGYGIKDVTVLPLIFPLDEMVVDDKEWTHRLSDGKINIIFTGRIAPNKKQDDIVKTFNYYHKFINSDSRLILAGAYDTEDCSYCAHLCNLIRHLDLEECVFLPGKIKDTKLVSLYKTAHLFISMSEHEGFCIPIVESMKYSIPILAYNSTAVPYTLGSGGILFNEKNFQAVAEMMHKIMTDKSLQKELKKNQQEMMKRYSNQLNLNKLHDIIKMYL